MTPGSSDSSRPTAEWIDRYLTVLGLQRAAPSAVSLAALNRAQVQTIVFENVTSLRRRAAFPQGLVPPLDLDSLLSQWERGAGGGVCFEHAAMFGALLRGLGYRVTPLIAQISFPASHQALLVEVDGARFLVDAGNGAPFLDPIPLHEPTIVRRASLSYRFRIGDAPDQWVQDRWIKDEWVPFCRYDLRPADPIVREQGYQQHHTPGQSWVVDGLRLIRCDDERLYSLFNDELSIFSPSGKTTEHLTDSVEYERLATEVFKLPALPIADALDALGFSRTRSPIA